ncbi:MAG: alkaline phosphatase family protein [Deltaproteobacteria bacterium]|nr:alkaline phosphatase family protein [Deltaproteobacteria bacterium]MCB9788480.1 alkaline phosphatase family protein [Deltaproteobacteria bacterium]
MKRLLARCLLAIGLALFAYAPVAAAAGPLDPAVLSKRPRLVVVLVIDQLRADYLTRFGSRFAPARGKGGAPGGFRWLQEHGAWYPQAEYRVLNALTAPGHATILTGAWPARTGVILNEWYQGPKRAMCYCVGDEGYALVGTRPTGRPRGTAPTALRGTTLGDALKLAWPKARVASISFKDRAAILLGGFSSDATLWFDAANFQWVTSTFYRPDEHLPGWADQLNQRLEARRGEPYVWEAKGEGSGASSDGGIQGFRIESRVGELAAGASPLALELTVDAAIAAVDGLALGRSGATDLLAVSFSPLDYVGHALGPTSREAEELLVAHDAAIARLLAHLAEAVPGGLDSVTVALTGDHGAPPLPARLEALRIPSVALDDDALAVGMGAALTKALGPLEGDPWVVFADKLHFYFDEEHLRAAGRDPARVRQLGAAWLETQPGIALAITRDDWRAGRLPPGLLGEQIGNSYHPGRSGDVVGVPLAFASTRTDPVVHMTGYAYDRFVPLVIASPAVAPGVYTAAAQVVDLAPTLAFIAGIVPPSLSQGRVLGEIFRPRAGSRAK